MEAKTNVCDKCQACLKTGADDCELSSHKYKKPWGHEPLRRQNITSCQEHSPYLPHLPCLAQADDWLANDG